MVEVSSGGEGGERGRGSDSRGAALVGGHVGGECGDMKPKQGGQK